MREGVMVVSTLWGWAVGLGACGYVAALVLLCLKGVGEEGRMRPRRAAWYILLAVSSLIVWAVGLLLAG